MIKVNNPYSIELKSESGKPYINAAHAIMAASAMMMYFANEGFLVSSHLDKETSSFEITVHFDTNRYPKNPNGYTFSYYTLTSHQTTRGNVQGYVRCKTFHFCVQRYQ